MAFEDLDSTAGVAGSFVGTANYMSPERALGKDYSFRRQALNEGLNAVVARSDAGA